MRSHVERIARDVVDTAFKLHRELGPGLLESVYEAVKTQELERRGYRVERQKAVSFTFQGLRFEGGLRVDMLVDRLVVVELKSIERLAPVHWKQVVTYVRLMKVPLGFLINFGGATLKEGLHRIVNSEAAGPYVAS